MRSRIAPLLLVLTLCLAPWMPAGASTPVADDSTWMTVLLDGRKIGQVRIDYQRDGDVVTTTQTLSIDFHRNGRDVPLSNMTRSVESTAGQPLAFAARTTLSAMDTTIQGQRQPDDSFIVTTTVGGVSRQERMDWPPGALLSEGQRLAFARAGVRPGQLYELRMFDPASLQVVHASMQVLGNEQVALPGGVVTLGHQRQIIRSPRGTQIVDLWLDERGRTRKGVLGVLGREMEMMACDRTCALAPEQHVDMLRTAMVGSPRPLSASLHDTFLRYRMHLPEGDPAPAIATDEQQVWNLGHGEWRVDIGPAGSHGEAPPRPEDSRPNAWLQSDSPTIRRLAAQVVGDASDSMEKMQRLRRFVSAYITPHGLDVGYASALEVVSHPQGDCTEYAVLLAALARAEGIPARVVTGMVYRDRYGGRSHVFVPHAWVQAWVDGHWQSFDAALRHFDSSHIAMDTGDGDPWHFFNITNLFSRLQIEDISPVKPAPVPENQHTRPGIGSH
ncbi:transglutaminase-like domain-containing protein [Dyella humicola]|uniref:transglutaminase-like domain-containing protein n=1 Tax=Dyella humicola TaxID=2992126 RepID=UPI0022573C00|nr:transglutaminase-like domain-containing protein [Dyella humicola]